MEFIRVVNDTRPRFFVFENVKGLTSIAVDKGGAPGGVLDIILEEFRKIGYKTVFGVLDAVNFGVPQFRERLIILGSRDNEEIFLPAQTHFMKHQLPQMRWRTLGETIKDIENYPEPCMHFSEERLRYLRMVPEGGNWRDLPLAVQPIAMGGAWKSGGGKVGFYRRLS